MVIKDDYSHYPIVERLTSLKSETVFPRLQSVSSLFGYASYIRTDNGPPFNSHAFTEFAEQSGFIHRKITPLHPEANPVERFMPPLQKAVKTAKNGIRCLS